MQASAERAAAAKAALAAAQAAANKYASDKAAADKAASDKAIADRLAAETKALADKLAAEKLAAENKAAIDAAKALADKLAAEKLAADKLAAEKAAKEKALADKLELARKAEIDLANTAAITYNQYISASNAERLANNQAAIANYNASQDKYNQILQNIANVANQSAQSANASKVIADKAATDAAAKAIDAKAITDNAKVVADIAAADKVIADTNAKQIAAVQDIIKIGNSNNYFTDVNPYNLTYANIVQANIDLFGNGILTDEYAFELYMIDKYATWDANGYPLDVVNFQLDKNGIPVVIENPNQQTGINISPEKLAMEYLGFLTFKGAYKAKTLIKINAAKTPKNTETTTTNTGSGGGGFAGSLNYGTPTGGSMGIGWGGLSWGGFGFGGFGGGGGSTKRGTVIVEPLKAGELNPADAKDYDKEAAEQK